MRNLVLFLEVCLFQALLVFGQAKVAPVAPTTCGTLNTSYLYNQRNLTQLDEFPWIARIGYRSTLNSLPLYQSLAVLISQRYLLTNANCFRYAEAATNVILGDWHAANNISETDCDAAGNCAPSPTAYDIEKIIIHPHYNRQTYSNNIALLRLSQNVAFTSHISPICLPTAHQTQRNFVAQHLELSGWLKVANDQSADMIKVKKFIHIVSLSSCKAKLQLSGNMLSENSHICALHTCIHGSSFYGGSALMGVETLNGVPTHYFLVGMIAFGPPGCSYTYPYVFTRVDRYLDWIRENILPTEETTI